MVGWRAVAALVACALLAGCGARPESADDAFSPIDTIVGAPVLINPLEGTKVQFYLESFVAKAPPHEVEHRLTVKLSPSAGIFASAVAERYEAAVDDTAASLKVRHLDAVRCGVQALCPRSDTIGIPLADALLRTRVVRGYRIKLMARSGEERIVALTPAMIAEQLARVDNVIQDGPPVVRPGAPLLGLTAVAASATPFAGPPRGVIVVGTTPTAPAAAGGVRPGDVLLAIDGQPVRVTKDVARIMAGVPSGHAATLVLVREGAPFTAIVQL